ncbi:protein YgfX [Candidatus Thiodiazotropha endoloripes]|uniref:protein YgfX n=1 Tax=Candidatus Thiodiazotropha endoloripes TaxID=1818881 RepID=UPI00083D3831|nr:protein YgfX [Candidatus Thiodiazotropha endoloripes]
MTNRLPTIHLRPAASRQWVIWHRSLYAITLLAIVTAPIGMSVKIVLLIALMLTKLPVYRVFIPGQVAKAEIRCNGWSKIVLTDGKKQTARLRTDSLVTPWLIILRFDLRGRWRHPVMVLFQDALPAAEMRSLRILLKHGSFVREESAD